MLNTTFPLQLVFLKLKILFRGLVKTGTKAGPLQKWRVVTWTFEKQRNLYHKDPKRGPRQLTGDALVVLPFMLLVVSTVYLPFIFVSGYAARRHFLASLRVGWGYKTEFQTMDYGVDTNRSSRSRPLTLPMRSFPIYYLGCQHSGELGKNKNTAELLSAGVPEGLCRRVHISAKKAHRWGRSKVLWFREVSNNNSK